HAPVARTHPPLADTSLHRKCANTPMQPRLTSGRCPPRCHRLRSEPPGCRRRAARCGLAEAYCCRSFAALPFYPALVEQVLKRLTRDPVLLAEGTAKMQRKIRRRVFQAFEVKLAIPTKAVVVVLPVTENVVGLMLLVSVGLHGHLQHRSLCGHIRQRQSSGSSKARGSSSPARVASMMLTARSDQSCARSASNGTRKCSHSQVSAFVTVNSAGLVILRYAW